MRDEVVRETYETPNAYRFPEAATATVCFLLAALVVAVDQVWMWLG